MAGTPLSGLTFWRKFDEPFYTGAAAAITTSAVSKYDVAFNGIGYMVDTEAMNEEYFTSINLLRSMFLQDRGTVPIGEHSLNPSDYWRRSVDDWSAGGGQLALDHSDSNNNQYRTSKGIDPWTAGSITLLHDTAKSNAINLTSAPHPKLAVAGTELYVLGDDQLAFGDTNSLTTVVHAAPDAALSLVADMTTDGYTIWVADATRVHYTARGTSTFTKYHTSDHVATLLRSTKGRLFSANGNILYTHSGAAGSAVATAYFTQPNSDWVWTDIRGGPDMIYFSGYSGDKSMVYGATIKTDATALDAPVVVATLPSGEIAQSMHQYLSTLVIGTNKGIRVAVVGSGGSLTLSGLIQTANPPLCFESQDRFIWFGWTDYDSTSTGLGRIDLSTFNSNTNAFAYSSDLMAATQGDVTSVVTFAGNRVFTVAGIGMYVEESTFVVSASITSGGLNFALAENKLAIKAIVASRASEGSYQMSLAVDDLAPVNIGNIVQTTGANGQATVILAPQLQGRTYEVGLTLFSSDTQTTAPTIDRWTLMVEPQPERRFQFTIPLLLHSQVRDRLGGTLSYEPAAERRKFYELCISRELIPFQDREQSYTVLIDDFKWKPYEHVGASRRQGSWDGTLFVVAKVVN